MGGSEYIEVASVTVLSSQNCRVVDETICEEKRLGV
jgi:hypothetical protein